MTIEDLSMIQLTRLNNVPLLLNSDLIEHIEVTPDTVITLTTGQKIVVRESSEEVQQRVIAFRKAIFTNLVNCPHQLDAAPDRSRNANGSN